MREFLKEHKNELLIAGGACLAGVAIGLLIGKKFRLKEIKKLRDTEEAVMDTMSRKYTIKTKNPIEAKMISENIHSQLQGNSDYIANNILVNCDRPNEVAVYIFKESETIPEITIL